MYQGGRKIHPIRALLGVVIMNDVCLCSVENRCLIHFICVHKKSGSSVDSSLAKVFLQARRDHT